MNFKETALFWRHLLRIGFKQTFQDELEDGSQGPVMVALPRGEFVMGDKHEEWSKPTHNVRIEYTLAVSKYPVTFDEYDAYCAYSGVSKPGDSGWGRSSRPAIHVNWDDVNGYCRWLSLQSGHEYRLLSEAEWEYAARARDRKSYPLATKWAGSSTAPVGSLSPNGFKLHDMFGNVLEWCQDCWNWDYNDAPDDGSAWLTGDCEKRVVRGGSWRQGASAASSYERGFTSFYFSGSDIGFRVARLY